MQRDGAMRINNALRAPRGAGRVTHRRRFVFVELRIREILTRLGQEFLVAITARRRRAATERHHDYALEFHLVAKFFKHRQQDVIDDQEAVARVVGDEADFVRVQPQVQRVEHASGGRDAEVRFQVLGLVPQQRGHPVSAQQPHAGEHVRKTARAPVEIAPGVTRERAVRPARDDFYPAENVACAFEQRRHREGKIHHQSAHGKVSLLKGTVNPTTKMLAITRSSGRASLLHLSISQIVT